VEICSVGPAQAKASVSELIELLQDAVESGASVGFLPPLERTEAADYWNTVFEAIARGNRVLIIAGRDGRVEGAVQLDLDGRPNASHRAEVIKLFVHRRSRRQGLGVRLMEVVESVARSRDRTLLVLDTREGDAAELLYLRLGYQRAGVIPGYARSSNGELDATVFMYKQL
jgi:ribosomal protein S18 acetylase RimI-like enzyme